MILNFKNKNGLLLRLRGFVGRISGRGMALQIEEDVSDSVDVVIVEFPRQFLQLSVAYGRFG